MKIKERLLETANRKGWVVDPAFEHDDGRVDPPYIRSCTKNIASMTVREFLLCEIFYWNWLKGIGRDIVELFAETFLAIGKGLLSILYFVVVLLFWWAIIPLSAYIKIRREKKQLAMYNRMNTPSAPPGEFRI